MVAESTIYISLIFLAALILIPKFLKAVIYTIVYGGALVTVGVIGFSIYTSVT